IIIALPYSDQDSLKQLRIMANELTLKGIDSTRISFEPLGINTRTQAVNIVSMLQIEQNRLSILVVTTPEHMYRAVHTLIKAGCYNVAGLSTFEKPIEEARLISTKNIKDTPEPNLSFRYNMWSYLNYELLVLREYVAISYYKYKGWL
ncbi:MAG: YdcF family protein, partial [Bacteroidales bacterium]|nr:YdcF family protein [Bacteroidales bacterium]